MRMRTRAARLFRCAGVLVVFSAVTPLTYATVLAPVIDITGGGFATVPLAPAVAGWQFHLDQPITVVALGLWDEAKLPLEIPHDVGLWKSDQTLLWVATLDNNSMPVASAFSGGQWLFTDIPALRLPPGDYVLGAVWGGVDFGADPFRVNTDIVSYDISYTGGCAQTQLPDLQLVFPCAVESLSSVSNASFFGPNLAVAVPEPGGFAMLGCGVLSIAGMVRRRSSQRSH